MGNTGLYVSLHPDLQAAAIAGETRSVEPTPYVHPRFADPRQAGGRPPTPSEGIAPSAG